MGPASGLFENLDAWYIANALDGLFLAASPSDFSSKDFWEIYDVIQTSGGGGDPFALKVDAALSSTPQNVKDHADNLSNLWLADQQIGVGAAPSVVTDLVDFTGKGNLGATHIIRGRNDLGTTVFELLDNGQIRLNGSQIIGTGSIISFRRNTGVQTYGFAFDNFTLPGHTFDNFGALPGLYPNTDNNRNLGKAAQRWKDAYFAGAVFEMSGIPVGAGGAVGTLYIDNTSIPGVNIVARN